MKKFSSKLYFSNSRAFFISFGFIVNQKSPSLSFLGTKYPFNCGFLIIPSTVTSSSMIVNGLDFCSLSF